MDGSTTERRESSSTDRMEVQVREALEMKESLIDEGILCAKRLDSLSRDRYLVERSSHQYRVWMQDLLQNYTEQLGKVVNKADETLKWLRREWTGIRMDILDDYLSKIEEHSSVLGALLISQQVSNVKEFASKSVMNSAQVAFDQLKAEVDNYKQKVHPLFLLLDEIAPYCDTMEVKLLKALEMKKSLIEEGILCSIRLDTCLSDRNLMERSSHDYSFWMQKELQTKELEKVVIKADETMMWLHFRWDVSGTPQKIFASYLSEMKQHSSRLGALKISQEISNVNKFALNSDWNSVQAAFLPMKAEIDNYKRKVHPLCLLLDEIAPYYDRMEVKFREALEMKKSLIDEGILCPKLLDACLNDAVLHCSPGNRAWMREHFQTKELEEVVNMADEAMKWHNWGGTTQETLTGYLSKIQQESSRLGALKISQEISNVKDLASNSDMNSAQNAFDRLKVEVDTYKCKVPHLCLLLDEIAPYYEFVKPQESPKHPSEGI